MFITINYSWGHHDGYKSRGGTAPFILNVCTRWRVVVNVTLRSLYLGNPLGWRVGPKTRKVKNFLPLPEYNIKKQTR